MVGQLFRLRLSLLGNVMVGSGGRRFGVVIGLLASLVGVIVVFRRVLQLGSGDPVTAQTDIVCGGALAVFAFVVIPLLLQRDDPVDPRRFALFGVGPSTLAGGLALSSLVALPVVALVVVALSTVIAWAQSPLGAALGVLGALLAVATCILCGRIFSALSAFALATRRAREVAGVIGVFVLVLLAPAIVLTLSLNWGGQTSWAGDLAHTLGLTPLGAAWAIPAEAAVGDSGGAFLSFVVAALTVAVLWFVWRALVAFMMLSSKREIETIPAIGLGWFSRLPSTPAGSIAARSLTYWARDPRYYVPLIIVPIVPIILAIPLMIVAFPIETYALVPLPVMCLFLGFAIHNDVALDNTAVWLHIVSGKRGVSDRVGRMAPVLLIGLPLIGVGSVVTVLLANNSAALPSILGVSTCVLFCSVGLGSLISARFPYAATRPGESPFTQPQATGSTSVFVQVAVIAGTLALSVPTVVLAILAELNVSDDLQWQSLWWGVGVGVFVIVLGAWAGGAAFNRRGPEILATSVRG